MAALTVQELSVHTASSATFVAADALGDTFPNTGNELVIVKIGATTTIVQVASLKCSHGFESTSPETPATAADVDFILPNLPVSTFGEVPTVSYDQVTDVSIAVIRIVKNGN